MMVRYSDTERVYDELLLRRVQAGDRRAGERLAARWYPRLMRTAFRLLRDEEQARSAVQDAWTGICKGWFGLRDPSRFPAWAYRILHNKCADRIRANQRKRGAAEMTAAEPPVPATAEDKVTLDQAFSRLSNDHRIAATLYFGEGLSAKEIAHVTDAALGTAKTRIFHARQHLKTMLSEHQLKPPTKE